MVSRKFSLKEIAPYLVRHRKALILVILSVAVSLGMIEHFLIQIGGEPLHIIFDILLYIIFLPIGVWILLNQLKQSEDQRNIAQRELTLRQTFSRQLSDVKDWNDFAQKVVRFPRELVPACSTSLLIYDREKDTFILQAACAADGKLVLERDELAHLDQPKTLSPAQICANPVILRAMEEKQSIELPALMIPLNRGERRLGVLQMDFPAGVLLSPHVLTLLHTVVDEIAIALEGLDLQSQAKNQAAATEDERRRIARDLHDTLAQNIGYLRLKLDQMTGEQSVLEISNVLSELSRMRDIANEAYQQVRDTLDQLTFSSEKDLLSALENHARVVGARANFQVTIEQIGTPRYVPESSRRQMVFIVRESLSNIENHARASCVKIQVIWRDQDMAIKVLDNGQGYDTQKTSPQGHYGLMIMQERAHEIGGYLTVTSAPGKGTEVTLRIPLDVPFYADY
jgi:nitrate/nitrite-specific signal transduction histidine kinase